MTHFWKTAISKVEPNKIVIRGHHLTDLIGKVSFGDMVYLLMKGELPPHNEGRMFDAILTAGCEHSLAAPSVDAVRFVASSGVPLQAAVAAGILALGDWHGGAMEECAKILQQAWRENEGKDVDILARNIVNRLKAEKKRMPGYGHPYHTNDPRVAKLFELCKEFGLSSVHVQLAQAVNRELVSTTKGKVSMNVDGAIAAISSDMKIDWRLGRGFYIIARSAGMVAHAFEQMTQEKPFKAIPLDEIEYTGPPEQPT